MDYIVAAIRLTLAQRPLHVHLSIDVLSDSTRGYRRWCVRCVAGRVGNMVQVRLYTTRKDARLRKKALEDALGLSLVSSFGHVSYASFAVREPGPRALSH